MHLHGSVLFGPLERNQSVNSFGHEDSFDDLYYYPNPKDAAESRRGTRGAPISQAGKGSIVGAIVTGLQKPDKVLFADPYSSYYRIFGLHRNLSEVARRWLWLWGSSHQRAAGKNVAVARFRSSRGVH
jgi:hypothetical protein